MKKFATISLSVVAVCCVLVLSAFICLIIYVNTEHATLMMMSQVNKEIPGRIEWHKLNLSLLQGKIEIRDFRLSGEDGEIVGFDKLFLGINPSRLIAKELLIDKFVIENPKVDIRIQENGDMNLMTALTEKKEGKEPEAEEDGQSFILPFNIQIDLFNLIGGGITYTSIPDDISAQLENLNIQGRGELSQKTASLTLKTGQIGFKNAAMDTTIDSFLLNAEYLTDSVSDLNIQIRSSAGEAVIKGAVRNVLSEPSLEITSDLNLAVERLLSMLNSEQNASGKVKIHTVFEGELNDPDVSLRMVWDDGNVMGRKIDRAALVLALKNRICDITDLEILHAAGILKTKGRIALDRAFPQGFMGKQMDLAHTAWDIKIVGNEIRPGIVLESEGISGLAGECSFEAFLSGTMTDPEVVLSFRATDAGYLDYPLVDVQLDTNLKKGTLTIDRLRAEACASTITLSGDVALFKEQGLELLGEPRLNLDLSSEKVNIGTCLKTLKMLEGQGVDGDIVLLSHITGTTGNPVVDASVKLTDLSLAGEKIPEADLIARLKGEKLFLDSLLITLVENQTIEGSGWVDMNKNLDISVYSDGINLSSINNLQKADIETGLFSCSVSAKGSVDNPELKGNMALRDLKLMGRSFEDFTADIQLTDHYATVLGKLGFDIHAGFDLTSRDFKADLLFEDTDLLPWFKLAGVSDVAGRTTGKVNVKGNADSPEKTVAIANIEELFVQYRDELSLKTDNIQGRTDGEKFNVAPFEIVLPENGHLSIEADGRIGGKINAQIKAGLPVSLAGMFVPELPVMEGLIRMDARAAIENDIKKSDVDARISLVDLGIKIPGDMGQLHGINGTILANLNSIEIPDIHGSLDAGTFNLSGAVTLKDFMPGDFNAALKATAIPVTAVDGLDASLSTDLSVRGNLEASLVKGEVLLEHGAWARDINLEKEIFSKITDKKRVRKGIENQGVEESILDAIALNVSIKGKKPFVIDNNMAYLEIHPDINVQGTAAAPVVSGRSEIDPGIIHYQSSDFTMTRGIIDFVNPYAIDPELDIQSERTVRDWNIQLGISGTSSALDFTLSSEPRLDHGDIISLLLRGKTINELINAEGGTTLSTAGMLSQIATSALSKDIKSATGLDIFEMGFGNNTEDNGLEDLNVTVGKEITEKMTLKYGTESKEGEMVYKTSAEYELMDNVSLNGFRDSEGQFGGEVRYRLEFR